MDNSLTSLLRNLTTSLASAADISPKELDIPTENGISLFDVKNELFLSYVQHLVFLVILKIRHATKTDAHYQAKGELPELNAEVVKTLVELRVYLDKGVKPLEGRLKYQIDKVVRAVEEESRASKPQRNGSHIPINKQRRKQIEGVDEDVSLMSNAEDSSDAGSEPDINDLALRPNAAGLMRAATQSAAATRDQYTDAADGIYHPPRINPVSMPTTERKEARNQRPEKSATLDEFIANEYSTAPLAEPSIGSTIAAGGRRNKSQRERNEDAERRAYEEANYMRLPNQGKNERARNQARFDGGFGGEEWRNLGAGLDRIGRLTQRKNGEGGSLARSKKRTIDSVDGPRGSGEQIGASFQKRRRNLKRR